MIKDLALIGAFDRYNYGDLLFPIVIEAYLDKFYREKMKNCKVNYYALTNSDLTFYGGKKTKSLSELLVEDPIINDKILIVSGGEVLPARLSNMFFDLETNRIRLILRKIFRKLIGIKIYEKLLCKKLNIKSNFPWIISKKNKKVKLLYNTVGGASLDKLSSQELKWIKNQLQSADYISVRDKITLSNLKEIKPKLYPDSAMIMSEIFPKSYLENMISNEIKNINDQFSHGYICVQSNLFSLYKKEYILAQQLELIKKKHNIGIILLPIGIAANHDDDLALNKLKRAMNIHTILPNKINVYEIMYLIANSRFFAGTSLHGNITAMSYSVPHIGLNPDIIKLEYYLKTWEIKEQNCCIEFNDLFNKFNELITIEHKKLESNREYLINLCYENFSNMFSTVFNN